MNTLIMPAAAARFNHVIAFDVSKASLSLHILPSGETLSLQNDGAAIRRLLKREQKRNCKQGLGSMLVICEATGGYEDAVLKTASELGLDCHRAHGSGVRAYAKFRGRHAKNDPIDAALIAGYGRDKPDLELYQPPRPEEAALRALMGRRTELKDMIQAETCRIEHASLKAVRVSLESHLAALKEQLALIEKEIRTLTRRDEAFNKRSRLMQTLAGIGAVASQTIQAFLPELGHVPSATAVALAGLAPYDRDSGKERGKRRIFGGRGQIRTCLYMAALAAIRSHAHFREFAERLTRRGKPFKVAVTAVMRKLIVILSAMIRNDQPWKHAQTA
ncbi:MAG: IS110 family transposase [Rhodomicrobium sp.]